MLDGLIHPTSGQYNSPHSYSQVSSSLSFSPAEVFGNSVAFFFFCASSSFDGLKKKRWKLHHLYS